MRGERIWNKPSVVLFNTLAQSETEGLSTTPPKPAITIKGKGIDATNQNRLNSLVQRKIVSMKLVLCLIDVSKAKGDKKQLKAYWNTYNCQRGLVCNEGRLYGHYCKNRFCMVCNGIRSADIIRRYLPVIETWDEPHFVTLTATAVPAKYLKSTIADFMERFKKVIRNSYKQYQRGKGVKLIGIKSLECCFKPKTSTYNPHFHIIVANREMADTLVRDWIAIWGKKQIDPSAQKIRRIVHRESDLIKVLNYGTKIFSDRRSILQGEIATDVYLYAMDTIISAISRRRIFDRFGFSLPKVAPKPISTRNGVTDYTQYVFDHKQFDWTDTETQALLTGFQ